MSNNQSDPGFVFGQVPSATEWNGYFSGKQDANPPRLFATAITLAASGDYGFTGSTDRTWALPLLTTQNSPYFIKNLGTGILTILCAGSDVAFVTSSVTAFTVEPGESAYIANYASLWGVTMNVNVGTVAPQYKQFLDCKLDFLNLGYMPNNRAPQGAQKYYIGGSPFLFVSQRVITGGAGIDDSFRLSMWPYRTGGVLVPASDALYTSVLQFSHQGVGVFTTDAGQLSAVVSIHNPDGTPDINRSKGLAVVALQSPLINTTQANVVNYQLFPYAGTGRTLSNMYHASVTCDVEGRYAAVVANCTNSPGSHPTDEVFYAFIYDLREIIATGSSGFVDATNVTPIYSWSFVPPAGLQSDAYQDFALNQWGLLCACGQTPFFGRHTLQGFSFNSTGTTTPNFQLPSDDNRGFYGLFGATGALNNTTIGSGPGWSVPVSAEVEGTWWDGDEMGLLVTNVWNATEDVAAFTMFTGLALTSITWAANVATATTTDTLPYTNGTQVGYLIAGSSAAACNGYFVCTVTSPTTFTFPLLSNPGTVTTPGTYALAQNYAAIDNQTGNAPWTTSYWVWTDKAANKGYWNAATAYSGGNTSTLHEFLVWGFRPVVSGGGGQKLDQGITMRPSGAVYNVSGKGKYKYALTVDDDCLWVWNFSNVRPASIDRVIGGWVNGHTWQVRDPRVGSDNTRWAELRASFDAARTFDEGILSINGDVTQGAYLQFTGIYHPVTPSAFIFSTGGTQSLLIDQFGISTFSGIAAKPTSIFNKPDAGYNSVYQDNATDRGAIYTSLVTTAFVAFTGNRLALGHSTNSSTGLTIDWFIDASTFALTPNAVGLGLGSATQGVGSVFFGTAGLLATSGTGSPNAAVTAPAGSLYLNASGGAGSTLWGKETGSGNTGWAAIASSAVNLSFFAATTSAQLASIISDETGSGSLVFATSPTFVTPILGAATATSMTIGPSAVLGLFGTTIAATANATALSGLNASFYLSPTVAPVSASSGHNRALFIKQNLNAPTIALTGVQSAFYAYNYISNIGNLSAVRGGAFFGIVTDASTVALGTVTQVAGLFTQAISCAGALTPTITSALGLRIDDSDKASSTITGQAGIAIAALAAGTNNVSILFGTQTIPSGNFGLYQADANPNLLTGTLTTGGIVGVTTNSSAAAGIVGELITASLASGSAVSLTTATTANVVSISLTAGDWDVSGVVDFAGSTIVATAASAAISTSTGALPAKPSTGRADITLNAPALTAIGMPTGTVQVSISGTTTVYLVAQTTFASGTATAYGAIRARRVR